MYLASSYQSLTSQKVFDRIHGVHMHRHIVCMLYGIYRLTNTQITYLLYIQWLLSLYSLNLKFRLYVCYGGIYTCC